MPRKCEICGKEFQSDSALGQHYRAKHPDAEPPKIQRNESIRRTRKQKGAFPRRNLVIIASAVVIAIIISSLGGIYLSHGNSTSDSASSSTSSVSTVSASTTFNYTPACIYLDQPGGVHVTGSIAPSSIVDVKSVTLWWRYHNSGNNWYQLNDLVLGQTFSTYGNFSHTWNPPSVNYYDFEVNWTISSGQVITASTSNPLQVVSQRTACP